MTSCDFDLSTVEVLGGSATPVPQGSPEGTCIEDRGSIVGRLPLRVASKEVCVIETDLDFIAKKNVSQ